MKTSPPVSEEFEKRFLHEILKSEKLRTVILATLFAFASLTILVIPPFLQGYFFKGFFKEYKGLAVHAWIGILLLIFFFYQCLVFLRYHFFTQESGRFVTVFQYVNTTVETSIPTFLIVIISNIMNLPMVLETPAVFLYFLFIALSSLRLSFFLCVYTGLVAGLEYIGLYFYFVMPFKGKITDPFSVAPGVHFFKMILLFIIGIAVGFVTLEIRKRITRSIHFVQERNELLKRYSENLEREVVERTRELNDTLLVVEEAKTKLTDSIEYAKRIQYALLPKKTTLDRILPNHFVIWSPRDIVGGDIYFAESYGENSLIAVIDCTGHGVPGAFMTMIASSALRKIITDEKELTPAGILQRLNIFITQSLQQDTKQTPSDDGLDASICLVNRSRETLTFAGARLPLVYVSEGDVFKLKGDRHSIGYKHSDISYPFTDHVIPFSRNVVYYLFTDGITDQLGGEKRLALGQKRFTRMLQEINAQPLETQKQIILQRFNDYRGDNEIQDDITVFAFSGRNTPHSLT